MSAFAGQIRQARVEVDDSIDAAWAAHRADLPEESDVDSAGDVILDPSRHRWRVVDAALDRLTCEACSSRLGSGPRGCAPCDLADGFRFAAQEPDRDGKPRGNEHAIRVSSAVLRSPGRYPDWAVRSNELFLPLFLAGQMPTRGQQETLLAAARDGWHIADAGEVRTFEDLVARVHKSR